MDIGRVCGECELVAGKELIVAQYVVCLRVVKVGEGDILSLPVSLRQMYQSSFCWQDDHLERAFLVPLLNPSPDPAKLHELVVHICISISLCLNPDCRIHDRW